VPANKIIPVKPLKAWSFSTYNLYTTCPAKVKYAKILKLPEPQNEAMARGDRIHKLAEAFIKNVPFEGKVMKVLPKELLPFKDELKRLRELYKQVSYSMVVEDNWAFTKGWDETAWNDWTGCWLRIKLDCAFHVDDVTLQINDWKSGKFRPEKNEEYLEQMELYALAALLLHDHIEAVWPRLKYTDLGITYGAGETKEEQDRGEGPLVFTRKDLPKLKKAWEKRVKAMMADTIFAPKPNNLCRFCHYRNDNGGPCQY
jgi:CRISPR/Cas system-associated exonuclease Cas4 (RecB family)